MEQSLESATSTESDLMLRKAAMQANFDRD